jgi:L-seryl-tRNA(Ser) seleniumtransferase
MTPADPRRRLPGVDAVVGAAVEAWPAGAEVRPVLARLAREAVALARAGGEPAELGELANAVAHEARSLLEGRQRRVINATGVLVQTNLGRSPLSAAAVERVLAAGTGYTNLEYELETGRRGERALALADTWKALLGVPALVVNNNAASLLLLLSALAKGREVIVSRGELVEIGGSFRLPDVMRLSGARLVEVGTTNRTRLSDYAEAIGPRTAMLLKVHTSNFRVVGFTESVRAGALAGLAHEHDLLAVEDLGSGSLLPAPPGLEGDSTVQDTLAGGVDLVAFSGDKLLGGPQAGILAGREDLVRKLGRHPLYRALRPDKLTLAALEGTLGAYLRGTARTELPLWRMLDMPAIETKARASAWAAALGAADCEVVPVESTIGGGSMPGQVLHGFGLALLGLGRRPSATTLARRLRTSDPPVVGRIEAGRVLLDPRTVAPEDDAALLGVLRAALKP